MKISVIGAGYVGLANAIVLSKRHKISVVDVDETKVNDINAHICPIKSDNSFAKAFRATRNIIATTDLKESVSEANLVIISVPTPLNEKTNNLDTSIVEETVREVVKVNREAIIVIKSTISVGTTRKLSELYNSSQIIYSPEFLREKHALEDINNPYRIVIGIDKLDKKCILNAREYGNLMISSLKKTHIKIRIIGEEEAEAVKLFSNAYLSMRLTYFNELDRFAADKGIKMEEIVDAICLDPRIGDKYNEPNKDGFSGKCLPKDLDEVIAETNSDLFKSVKKVNNKK